jgi:hypothetical protein
MKRVLFLAALVVAAISVVAGSALAAGSPSKTNVIYNSVINGGPPSNLPSVGAEAYAFNEFGNGITFAGTARRVSNVVVTLSSWGCVQGTWLNHDCSTPSGATFSLPMTLNIYDAAGTTLVATSTQTFTVPYRPSASPKCTGDNAGKWYSSGLKACFNGFASNVTFNFAGVTLPDRVVYGIAYNTSHYGYTPIGEAPACYGTVAGCPYDSLNIALSDETTDVSAGTDTNQGTIWQDSSIASEYCDNGVAGTGTFRLDSVITPCWSPYVPAVQFKASNGS